MIQSLRMRLLMEHCQNLQENIGMSNLKMNETTAKAVALSVILSAAQEIIDDIDQDGFFRHKLKYTQKNFSKELESFMNDLYGNMSEEAQQEFHERTKKLKQSLEV